MLPQFLLSKIETHPPTCWKQKGENRNWAGGLKCQSLFLDVRLSVWKYVHMLEHAIALKPAYHLN
jgi:hypothetical protein